MDLGLKGKVAFVTGGSRGVGHACAAGLMEEGAKVALVSRDPERLEAARAKLVEKTSGTAIAVPTDLRSDDAVRQAVERTVSEFGRIDILINAAATVTPADFLQLSETEFLDLFEQKLNGYARCLRHVLPLMIEQSWGRIINISGLAARQPHVETIPVNLNNTAVVSLSKSLATQYAKKGVLINTVIPHIINTDRQDETMQKWAKLTGQSEEEVRAQRVAKIPIGRMGKPEEVADVVTFLASDRSSFVCGAIWHVDGGVAVSI